MPLPNLDEVTRWHNARAVLLVAPQLGIDELLVERLVHYISRGGCVVLVSGSRDMAGLEPLLARLRIGIRPVLLQGKTNDPTSVRFVDPNPLDLSQVPTAKVIAAIGAEPVIAWVPHAEGMRGGVLIVADTRFFSSNNLEGVGGAFEPNLAFTRALIEQYLTAK
jgi:hypothetical protein